MPFASILGVYVFADCLSVRAFSSSFTTELLAA
jgi:hypothetical protein